MQTKCPNCQAQFIVTQESLEIADGMVRCGQCDQVFDAEENFIDESSEAASSDDTSLNTDSPSSIEQAVDGFQLTESPAAGSLSDADDELELVEMDYASEDLDEASGLINNDLEVHQLDPNDNDIYNSLIEDDSKKNTALNDEFGLSLDDELLDTDFMDNFDADIQDSDFSLDEKISDSIEKTPLSDDDISDLSEASKLLLNESVSETKDDFDDLDSGDDLLTQLDQLEESYESSSLDDKNISIDDSLMAEDPSLADEGLSSTKAASDNTPSSDYNFPSIDESIVMEDTSLPARKMPLDSRDEPSFFRQSTFNKQSAVVLFSWLAGCVVLILLLGAQYLHFNSKHLAQDDTYRPFLEILCPISHCKLPLFKVTRKIITIEHDVYSHKTYENALEVQLTFKNKASTHQAYPVLEIIFSNPLGAVIAQRKFSPVEYLENKKLSTQGMKPNQSQKVKLHIIDPDPSALLSFQFNYL